MKYLVLLFLAVCCSAWPLPIRIISQDEPSFIEAGSIQCGQGACPITSAPVCCADGLHCCPDKCVMKLDTRTKQMVPECRFLSDDDVKGAEKQVLKEEAQVLFNQLISSGKDTSILNAPTTPEQPSGVSPVAANQPAPATPNTVGTSSTNTATNSPGVTPIVPGSVPTSTASNPSVPTNAATPNTSAGPTSGAVAGPTSNAATSSAAAASNAATSNAGSTSSASSTSTSVSRNSTLATNTSAASSQNSSLSLPRNNASSGVVSSGPSNTSVTSLPSNVNATNVTSIILEEKKLQQEDAALKSNLQRLLANVSSMSKDDIMKALTNIAPQPAKAGPPTADRKETLRKLKVLAERAHEELMDKQELLQMIRMFANAISPKAKLPRVLGGEKVIAPIAEPANNPFKSSSDTGEGGEGAQSLGGNLGEAGGEGSRNTELTKEEKAQAKQEELRLKKREEESKPQNVSASIDRQRSTGHFRIYYQNGTCELAGTVNGGKVGLVSDKIPQNCRPSGRLTFTTLEVSGGVTFGARVDITPDGKLWQSTTNANGRTTVLYLDGVMWPVAPSASRLSLETGWIAEERDTPPLQISQDGDVCRVFGRVLKEKKTPWGAFATVPQQCVPDAKMILSGNNNEPIRVILRGGSDLLRVDNEERKTQWISLSSFWVPKNKHKLELEKGWHPYGFQFRKPGYTKIGKIVYVSGVVMPNSTRTNRTVATLPDGFRPARIMNFATSHGKQVVRVKLFPNGTIFWADSSSSLGQEGGRWLSLFGINFFVEEPRPEGEAGGAANATDASSSIFPGNTNDNKGGSFSGASNSEAVQTNV